MLFILSQNGPLVTKVDLSVGLRQSEFGPVGGKIGVPFALKGGPLQIFIRGDSRYCLLDPRALTSHLYRWGSFVGRCTWARRDGFYGIASRIVTSPDPADATAYALVGDPSIGSTKRILQFSTVNFSFKYLTTLPRMSTSFLQNSLSLAAAGDSLVWLGYGDRGLFLYRYEVVLRSISGVILPDQNLAYRSILVSIDGFRVFVIPVTTFSRERSTTILVPSCVVLTCHFCDVGDGSEDLVVDRPYDSA